MLCGGGTTAHSLSNLRAALIANLGLAQVLAAAEVSCTRAEESLLYFDTLKVLLVLQLLFHVLVSLQQPIDL